MNSNPAPRKQGAYLWIYQYDIKLLVATFKRMLLLMKCNCFSEYTLLVLYSRSAGLTNAVNATSLDTTVLLAQEPVSILRKLECQLSLGLTRLETAHL